MMKRKNLTLNKSLWDMPTNTNITYFWNFGSMLGMTLMLQIISGFILTMFYTSYYMESFNSINNIMNEIWMGWMLRLTHLNGASMFFIFIYLHLLRGLYFNSNKNMKIWMTGSTIMLLMMMISFLGYVLPWGQMSYWAVSVITNLITVLPIAGDYIISWIWGGFSVNKPTLMRFYSLHFITPLMLTLLVTMHLFTLHQKGSSNPMGFNNKIDKMEFNPYFIIKDMIFILFYITMMFLIISIKPMLTLDPINNVPANPLQTPIHIQPEWYFLPYYTILRAMPSKSSGVLMLVMSVMIFMILPIFNFKKSSKFYKTREIKFWMFISSFMSLMILGMKEAEEPFILISKMMSMMYFLFVITINI